MKIRTKVSQILALTIAAALLTTGGSVRGADAGHYNGGLMDIRDYFVPDPGFYAGHRVQGAAFSINLIKKF